MKKSVGIIGANGYTGSELVRLLAFHPNIELKFLFSRSNSGVKISDLYPDLDSICDLVLTNEISQTDILFLCLPHKESQNWLNENPVSDETLIIDLGNDFRLKGDFRNRNFIYGLPEIILVKSKVLKVLPILDVLQLRFSCVTAFSERKSAERCLHNRNHWFYRSRTVVAGDNAFHLEK
jgi:N-acetyl-gamma-glutamylphosphate reductase